MSWPSFFDFAASAPGGFLVGGVCVAIIQGLFYKPKERALTEKEKALAEKERALARHTEADTSIELVRLWMISNEKLLESNHRLEKSNERIQNMNGRLQKEMNETRRVLLSLVEIVERFMPLLLQAGGNEVQITALVSALERARAINGY